MRRIFQLAFAAAGLLLLSLMAQRTVQAQSQSPQAPEDEGKRVTGIVHGRPVSGTIGAWRIADITVTANATTSFPSGALALGACARADYQLRSGVNLAAEIRSSSDCNPGGGEGGQQGVEFKGIVQSFPENLIGLWQISGQSYTATIATQFEQHEGPFKVGVCVEVKHAVSSTLALRINTEDGCAGGGGEHSFAIARGKLISFPAEFIGTWTVNTTTYQVSTTTELRRRHGDFFVGSCVQVIYDPATAERAAKYIETESPDDCDANPSVITPTLEAHGVITSRPEGSMFGAWVIGGKAYQAISGTTSFKQEHGSLSVNKCAEVKYFLQGEGEIKDRIAVRIESGGEDDCGREGDHDGGKPERHEAFGAIISLPNTPDLIGIWQIGERAYTVTTATLLSNGPFTPGLFVEVQYTRTLEGGFIAARIEGKQQVDERERHEGKAYGRIDSRPLSPTVQGTWVVASVTYSVTNNTRLYGSLNVSDCVQIHYRVDDGGLRIATKIKQDERCRVEAGKPINKAHGFVTMMPANGFVGTWKIGGVLYEASATTQFSETNGALVVGAFVEVEYSLVNGVRIAREISTHVAPEAGEVNDAGKLLVSAPGSSPEATQIWSVNGKTYQIVDATLLDDLFGALSNGQNVTVNAYVDGSGQRVATKVSSSAKATVFVPVVFR